jgi:hypothetical protein
MRRQLVGLRNPVSEDIEFVLFGELAADDLYACSSQRSLFTF